MWSINYEDLEYGRGSLSLGTFGSVGRMGKIGSIERILRIGIGYCIFHFCYLKRTIFSIIFLKMNVPFTFLVINTKIAVHVARL